MKQWTKIFIYGAYILLIAGCTSITSISSPERNIISSSLPIELLWQSNIGEKANNLPIISDNIVVVSTSQAIYGFDAADGKQKWKHTYKPQPASIPLAVSRNKVVYGNNSGAVTALNLMTGEVIWQHKIPYDKSVPFIGSLVIANDIVYVASQPTVIEALDLKTGNPVWSLPDAIKLGIGSRAAKLFLAGDDLYVFTTEVHLLDRATGEIKSVIPVNIRPYQVEDGRFYGDTWVRDSITLELLAQFTAPSKKPLHDDCEKFNSTYFFSHDQFYATGRCGGTYAISTDNQTIEWEYRPEIAFLSPAAIYNGDLYVLADNGEIHAIDQVTGESHGILKTDQSLPYALDIGLVTNGDVLITTFNENVVWAFCIKPCTQQISP